MSVLWPTGAHFLNTVGHIFVMARQDIIIDEYGELMLDTKTSNKKQYPFLYLGYINGLDNDNYCYAEIKVPYNILKIYSSKNGLFVSIPYIPEYKKLKIRFRLDAQVDGNNDFLVNPTNNSIWFDVFDGHAMPVMTSCLLNISPDFIYNIFIENGSVNVYAGTETDMVISISRSQNESILLKASPGNMYQFPSTGVGLIDYMHSNLERSALAKKMQSEFLLDGVRINSASMDSENGSVQIESEEIDG